MLDELKRLEVVLGPQGQEIPETYKANVTMDAEGFLHFPLLLIYPEYKTTDYITDAH